MFRIDLKTFSPFTEVALPPIMISVWSFPNISLPTIVNSLILSWKLISLFTIGSILMRGAGCIINDLWDKDIDSQVARTKNRPIANGNIAEKEALIGLSILIIISSILLLFLPFKSFLIAVLSLPLIILYPLAKRYTKYPQLALGIVFSWGVPLGWSATNTDFNLEVVIMYLGTIAWVFGYDTIYSIQDKKDDMQLRVHSTSLTFKNKTKIAVSIAYFLCFILLININSVSYTHLTLPTNREV